MFNFFCSSFSSWGILTFIVYSLLPPLLLSMLLFLCELLFFVLFAVFCWYPPLLSFFLFLMLIWLHSLICFHLLVLLSLHINSDCSFWCQFFQTLGVFLWILQNHCHTGHLHCHISIRSEDERRFTAEACRIYVELEPALFKVFI